MYPRTEATPMSLRDDLSDNAQVILEGLYECGGEANMTEMKQVTGLEESKTILYHAEKYLEPSNFIEYEIVDDGSVTGITEFTITERGRNAVGSLIEGTDDTNLVEKVEDLREAVSQMKREVDTFAGRLDEVDIGQEDIDGVRESVRVLRSDVEAVEDRMSDLESDLDMTLATVEAKVERIEHFHDELTNVLLESGVIETSRNHDGNDGYEEGQLLGGVREALREP